MSKRKINQQKNLLNKKLKLGLDNLKQRKAKVKNMDH